MPGVFEEWQDDHCGQRRWGSRGKPEGMRVRWDANSSLLSSQSRDEGEGDLLNDGPAGVVEMGMCLLGPPLVWIPLCGVAASDSLSHKQPGWGAL